jgi:hypothetical protein
LSDGTVDAKSGHRQGIVSADLDAERFEAECVEWIQRVLTSGMTHAKARRQWIYHDIDALDAYLKQESIIQIQASNAPRRG